MDPDPSAANRRIRSLKSPYWIPVNGSSMRPLLRDEDSVYINPLAGDLSELRPGDIILLMDGDMPVVHRYLGSIGESRFERADFSNKRRPVRDEDIIGLALLRRRRGRVTSLRRSPLWDMRRWVQGWLGVKR